MNCQFRPPRVSNTYTNLINSKWLAIWTRTNHLTIPIVKNSIIKYNAHTYMLLMLSVHVRRSSSSFRRLCGDVLTHFKMSLPSIANVIRFSGAIEKLSVDFCAKMMELHSGSLLFDSQVRLHRCEFLNSYGGLHFAN